MSPHKWRRLFLAAALVTICGRADAGAGAWTSGGPFLGRIANLIVDPVTPVTVYAADNDAGVFKSTDAGATWSCVQGEGAYTLAMDPTDPATLYAGLQSTIYKSTDAGMVWSPTHAWFQGRAPLSLAIDPVSPGTVYVGTDGRGVYKSTDGGAHWSSVGPAGQVVHGLASKTASTVYAATAGGVFESINGAASWTQTTTTAMYSISVDPAAPNTVYAGSYGGLLKSTDAGGSWSLVAGVPSVLVAAVSPDPTNSATVYAGTAAGLLRSTDGGASWAGASTGLASGLVSAVAVDPLTPTTLYAGLQGGGVFRSIDSAGTWMWSNTGMTTEFVLALALDPSAPSTLYAGTPSGVQKSTDAGGSWTSTDLASLLVLALRVDPATPSTLYAGTEAGVYKSTDRGATWVPVNTGLDTQRVRALAISPSLPSTLYAGLDVNGVFRSTDAGATWAYAGLSGWSVAAVAVDPANSSTVYAGTETGWAETGIYKSTNAGISWNLLSAGPSTTGLAVDPAVPANVYASSQYGVVKSTDAGLTWINAPGTRSLLTYAIALHPAQPATVFIGTQHGVFRSTDSGASWGNLSYGLPNKRVRALALDPSGSAVYAGMVAGSVWQAGPVPVPFAKGDFDHDGQADLVFSSTVDSTQHKLWMMNGVARVSESAVIPNALSADWELRGVDDFDLDAQNDLVFWNRTTGVVEFWLMNGSVRKWVGRPTYPEAQNWQPVATADFNYDGMCDVLWRDVVWQTLKIVIMNGTESFTTTTLVPNRAVDANWVVVAARDYNGDGTVDLLWYNGTSGKVVTWYMDVDRVRLSGAFTTPSAAGDNNWKVQASADYSGTAVPPPGAPDIVWRNETSGKQVVWHMDFSGTRVHGEFTSPAANSPALDWTIAGPR